MPLILTINPKPEEREWYSGLRCEGLRKRSKIGCRRLEIHAPLIKSIERLRAKLSDGIYCVRQDAPSYRLDCCAETKLLAAPTLHHIFGYLIVGEGTSVGPDPILST